MNVAVGSFDALNVALLTLHALNVSVVTVVALNGAVGSSHVLIEAFVPSGGVVVHLASSYRAATSIVGRLA